MPRHDGRKSGELRPVTIRRGFISSAEDSVLFGMGRTRVLCTATIEDSVPSFLKGSGRGWITAEYGMLPRSSPQRIARESVKGRVKGRTQEIQRLIGRSIRAGVDLEKIGERTITVDCDVLEADGGTRTASINGGFMAVASALRRLGLASEALDSFVAAVSVGIVGGRTALDLDYVEDSSAEVDMNIVMNGRGELIEIQGTAEDGTFTEEDLGRMLKSARRGISRIIKEQKAGLRWR
ncbi:MAG TPA: ribonuclease PH [Candidatus Eisenbacteria bacterium]|mgnify:CR=1 FL=1|uniref:Ribonuclease PH n=1 Tax=Eiseniibacteriota bacterium TaxID=2212470 RepID=A0A7V2F3W8_UNCEI|nr:ribonuclease PH [Candidatus Eisenbacteria bacterium]